MLSVRGAQIVPALRLFGHLGLRGVVRACSAELHPRRMRCPQARGENHAPESLASDDQLRGNAASIGNGVTTDANRYAAKCGWPSSQGHQSARPHRYALPGLSYLHQLEAHPV